MPSKAMTSDLHLQPRHRRVIEGLAQQYLPGVDIWAYGSRVNGQSHDGSDLDLVLRGPELAEVPSRQLAGFREALQESTLPFLVEARDWARLPKRFHGEIQRNYVVLVSAHGRWRDVTLGDCIEMNDAVYTLREQWPFINYLDTGNLTRGRIDAIQHLVVGEDKVPSRARRKVKPGDVLYSTVRPNQRHFGVIKDVPENFLASTGFAVIRGKAESVRTDFIYWFLAQDSVVERLQTIAEHSASAYPSIRPIDIERLRLELPPLPEQRAIASVLGSLDDKIELNRRMAGTLGETVQALFKSWFVDFDPVCLGARQGTGLPPEIVALFPRDFVASDIGEVPSGWEVRPLGDLVELAYGSALRSSERHAGSVPVFGSNGQVGWHDRPLVDGPGVVVGRKGNPGVVTWSQGSFFPIDTTFYVVPKNGVSMAFLFCALRHQNLPSVAADSAVPGLNRNIAYMGLQLVPNTAVVGVFDRVAAPVLARISRCEDEANALAALRDTLLPKLVSGEILTEDAVEVDA